ncbi:glutathione peroxidase [Neptuniibacter halophilus]|uniref:glutathione peroxidase n=1 Tax=Neptuniibacter halophilus TaxID=651666 RepID=UPI002573AFC9|nr:glutathione peroxidase [Neptuniibacter halophilus]
MNWLYSVTIMALLGFLMLSKPLNAAEPKQSPLCPQSLDFTFKRLGEAQQVHLCQHYLGKLILVVNTASKCAYTPQYDGLEQLYREYKDRGLVVLGFPSNDFAGQEPGTEQQILEFCRLTYSVEFPMFEKVHAARGKADPFYQFLARKSGEYPGWNFHKYLIAPDGQVVGSFKSHIKPSDPEFRRFIRGYLPSL